MDRASDYGSEGSGFDSLQARQILALNSQFQLNKTSDFLPLFYCSQKKSRKKSDKKEELMALNPRVKDVKANPDFTLSIFFTNNEVRLFDIKPYLHIGVFRELQNLSLFMTAKPVDGTVQWIHNQDLCPDVLYRESTLVSAN